MLIYYTDEQKKEFLDAIAAQGCGVEKAYKLVKEGWKAAGKRVPNINTIYNWRKTVRQASPAAPSKPCGRMRMARSDGIQRSACNATPA